MIETKILQHECISIRSNRTVKSLRPTTVANHQTPSKMTRDLSSHMTMDLCLEGNNIPESRSKKPISSQSGKSPQQLLFLIQIRLNVSVG
jgi:hypothetical protein